MRKRILGLVIVLVIIIIGGGLWWYYNHTATSTAATGITASGFIESTNVSVSSEISGRIITLTVNEGDTVKAGDTLVKLDDSSQKAQLNQAAAALAVAQAGLQQASAAHAQSTIYSDGAKKAWQDTLDVQNNPLELDSQIAQAQSQLDLAELALKYQMNITNLPTFALGKPPVLPWTIAFATQQRDGAKMVLDSLLNIKNNPQSINSSVDQMHTAYLAALAAVDVADKAAQTSAKQVDQTQASLTLAQVQLTKTTVTSPVSATVTKRNAEVGEVTQPGFSILTLSELDPLTLTVYIPENKIGLVKLGQTAAVTVDSYPWQSFTGKVTYISPQAEFTPKNVQTVEERAKTVFATKITLSNQEQKLKPGMPADANIAAQ
jgi:HlyD family secretion protein